MTSTKTSFSFFFSYLKQAAEQGHGKALYLLGMMFELGQGCEKKYTTAYENYKLAADKGEMPAIYAIGVCCF